MTREEVAVNSYDVGQRPYIHDPNRGKWASQWDFYSASFANAFGMRTFFIFALYMQITGGAFIIIPIIISALFFVIPVFFVQSFMGQFSSTGFISVFRISPIFKGIGYVILILNILSAIYNSSVATYPLLFFLMSFQFNTTWMYCDNSWNSPNCTDTSNRSAFTEDKFNTTDSLMPSFEYFYHGVLRDSHDPDSFNISWTIILGEIFIWIVVGYIVSCGIVMVGKVLRYTTLISSIISFIIFVRICFLPEIKVDTQKFFEIAGVNKHLWHLLPWIVGPMVSSSVLGRGWGTTLTVASFQPFRKNVELYSHLVPMVMATIAIFCGYTLTMIEGFVARRSEISIRYFDHESVEYLFVAVPYCFGKLEASQMWSMLFFFMFFISETGLLVIQIFSIVTALADEFEVLRFWRYKMAVGLSGISCILSMFFATEHLTDAISSLLATGYVNQIFICFLEIMIVVWIYGRERFMRDVRYILSRNIAQWKFYIIRFITPILICLAAFVFVLITIFHMFDNPAYMRLFVLLIKGFPWIFIPGYAIVKLVTTIGTIPERVKKCIRPNDWYPADSVDKQNYDIALGTSDVSQQLYVD